MSSLFVSLTVSLFLLSIPVVEAKPMQCSEFGFLGIERPTKPSCFSLPFEGGEPLTFLTFNINPDGVAAVLPDAPAKAQ